MLHGRGLAHVPQEEVIHLHLYRDTAAMDTYAKFPNLRTLSSYSLPLFEVFPNPNRVWDEISPSLDHVRLERAVVHNGDWSPLATPGPPHQGYCSGVGD